MRTLAAIVLLATTIGLSGAYADTTKVHAEDIAPPQALDALPEKKIEDADLSEAATKAIQDAAAQIEAKAKPSAAAAKSMKEADIPVLTTFTAKKAAVANPWARMIFSFIVIALAATGLILFSRWYSRKQKGVKDNSKIRVLTQHFLGPRKSLAIVRVAGETILIGVTDQNISMLKSLALLDEDIPEATPNNFSQSLAKADKAAVPSAEDAYGNLEDFVVSNVKDKVFSKLKNLRPL